MQNVHYRNGRVKAKFAYLCTIGCCRLRNTLLVKLCTSWDESTTAGNSLENHFPEYLTAMLSRCVDYQEYQQIFDPSGQFLILERAKNRKGITLVNKVDGQFFITYFLAWNSRTHNTSCAGALTW
jgi:hypothetical protein